MNGDGDFLYVTRSGLDEFRVLTDLFRVGNLMKSICDWWRNLKTHLKEFPWCFLVSNQSFLMG